MNVRSVWRRGATACVVALAAMALVEPALAAEATDTAHAAGEAAHGSGGLPQLNPSSYASQIFWTLVTFGLLFWLMSKVALPRVAEVLEARQEKLTNDLEKAAALKAEAEGVMQAYERALADARSGAQKVLGEASAAADAEAARRNGELATELAQSARAAEERIQAAKQGALGNVRSVAAEAAQAAVARLVGVTPADAEAGAAVDAVMKEGA